MRNEDGPNGLNILVGLIVIGAFATAKTCTYLKKTVGQMADTIGHYLLVLLKIGAVAAVAWLIFYGVYTLVLWIANFLARVDGLEKRVSEIGERELHELTAWVSRLSSNTWSVEVELREFRKKVLDLEEAAKKAKDASAVTIDAVVSEIKKNA